MKTTKKLCFCLLLAGFLVFIPTFVSAADNGRYFVSSSSGFWKNALGVRHNFDNGFTTDASDFQLRLARVFGVDIEPVAVLQILPAESADATLSNADEQSESDPQASPSPMLSSTPTPAPTKILAPKEATRGKDGTVRYLPSDKTPWG